MRAVRVMEPGVLAVSEVPEPPSDRVVVQVHQVGICGTDTKIFGGKIPVEYPRIMGHEVVGEVVSAPQGAPYQDGQRVLVDPCVACGWCHLCRAGKPNLCINGGLLGRDVDGVFAQYVAAPVSRLIPVPDNISDRAAGLLQVLGTCVHACKRVNPFPGGVAAVIGLGVSGQLIAQLLTMMGMQVVGITRSEWKRRLAIDNGVAVAAEPSEAVAALADVTSGRGPQVVVEAVGTEATLSEAVSLAGTGGDLMVFGTLTEGSLGLPYYELYRKELTVHNPRAAIPADYEDGIALAATGALRLDDIVSHVLTLEDAARAFDLVRDSASLKVLMKVG